MAKEITDTAEILAERGSRYGEFKDNAKAAQALKEVYRSFPGWAVLPDDQREALDLIALKMSRILTGDPLYPDNWVDIEGYARLVREELEKLDA